MKNTKIIISLFLSFIVIHTNGQEKPEGYNAQTNLNNIGKSGYRGPIQTFNTQYEGVKGSPFLYDKWKKGVIMLNDGGRVMDIEIMYDVFKKELFFRRQNENNTYKSNLSMVSHFFFYDDSTGKFVKKRIISPDGKSSDEFFLKTLYQGKNELYLWYGKEFIKADYKGAYSANRPYDEFVSDQRFYLKKPDGYYYKLKPNRTGIRKQFPGKFQTIKKYIKEHNLDIKESKDLITLIKYIDSLQASQKHE